MLSVLNSLYMRQGLFRAWPQGLNGSRLDSMKFVPFST